MQSLPIKISFFLTISLATALLSCNTNQSSTLHSGVQRQTQEIDHKLIAIRRDFHQHPELAGFEKRTAKVITEHLKNLGLEVKTNIAGHGVIGILKGTSPGKNIAWRADMDAIPAYFPEKVAYKSKFKGIQHGCGHDVHMAIGLGIAEIISKNKEALKGTVYFIFQPEEETFVGAKNMANHEFYSEMHLDEIFALHVTALPKGQIMVKPNELYAYQKILQLKFKADMSITEAKELFKKIRTETLRTTAGFKPWEIPKAFETNIGMANPNTPFQDYFFIDENAIIEKKEGFLSIIASAYETNSNNLPFILPTIDEIVRQSKFKDHYISSSFIQENPTIMNHEALTKSAITTFNQVFGEGTVVTGHGQIPHFNDDFIYFQQKTPGVYFLFGGANSKKGIRAMNHAPNFDVDEASIAEAVQLFSSFILERTMK